MTSRVPRAHCKAVYAGAVAVIAGRLSAADYKVQIDALFEGTAYLRSDGSSAWWDYFSEEWLGRDSFILCSLAFRTRLMHFLLHTNNKCESEIFSILGRWLPKLMANLSEAEAIRVTTGFPLPDDVSARGQRRSIVGRSLMTLSNMLGLSQKNTGGWRREAVLKHAESLGDRASLYADSAAAAAKAAAAAGDDSSDDAGPADAGHTRLDARISDEAAHALGTVVIGGEEAYMKPSASVPADAPPMMKGIDSTQAFALGYQTQLIRQAKGLDDDGRARQQGALLNHFVVAMNRIAMTKPTPKTAAVQRPQEAVIAIGETAAGRLALLTRPSASNADFELLQQHHGRSVMPQVLYIAQLLTLGVHPDLLATLDDVLRTAPDVWYDDTLRLAAAERVMAVMKDCVWPLARRSDFLVPPQGSSVGPRAPPPTMPHVDIVYFVWPEFPARAALRQGEIVWKHGCRKSLLTHAPLDIGFTIALSDQLGMAEVLRSAGRDGASVPAGYVGRECHRNADTCFTRPGQHFAPGGSTALSEVAHRRSMREGIGAGIVYTPLMRDGDAPLTVRRRIIAALPHGNVDAIDLLESVLMYLLSRAGVCLYNSTPGPGPSSGGARYLEDSGDTRAMLDVQLEALLSSAGATTLSRRAAGDSVSQPFLRRALLTAKRFVEAGQVCNNGKPVVAESGVVSQLLAADMLAARNGRPAVIVQLALNACSCGPPQALCGHLVWARQWYEANFKRSFPVTGADWLLFTLRCGSRPAQPARFFTHTAPPPAAAAQLRPADAAAAAGMSLVSALLLLPHAQEHSMSEFAVIAARLAADVARSTQKALSGGSYSHSGSGHAIRGGLRTQREIAEERARSVATFDVLPTTPQDMLAFSVSSARSFMQNPPDEVVTPRSSPGYLHAIMRTAVGEQGSLISKAMGTVLQRAASATYTGGSAAAAAADGDTMLRGASASEQTRRRHVDHAVTSTERTEPARFAKRARRTSGCDALCALCCKEAGDDAVYRLSTCPVCLKCDKQDPCTSTCGAV